MIFFVLMGDDVRSGDTRLGCHFVCMGPCSQKRLQTVAPLGRYPYAMHDIEPEACAYAHLCLPESNGI
jgi:hypothetical protein